MYQCVLQCQIISSDDRLEKIMRNVPLPERFAVELQTTAEPDEEQLKMADMFVVDDRWKGILPKLRKHGKEDACVYLCVSDKTASSLSDEECAMLDGIWPTSSAESGVRLAYRKTLEGMKTAKDGWLSNNYLNTLIDSIPDLVWFKDIRGAHLKVNESFCRTVGKTKEQCEGRGHYYIWDLEPEDYEKGEYVCLETEQEVLEKKETCLFDELVKGKQGLHQFKTYKSPIFDSDGSLIGTVGIAHDVTDLKNIDKELEIILQSLPFAVLIIDENDIVTGNNEKFIETFQISSEEIIGQNYARWKAEFLAPSNFNGEDGFENENIMQIVGQKRFVGALEEPIEDIFHNCIGHFCIFQDVTTEYHLRQQILHRANTDFLTGLYNRRYLYDCVQSFPEGTQISVLSFDLDNFKDVNDTYGHQIGDETIVEVAHLIRDHFSDGCVARMGGDEFVAVLSGAHDQDELMIRASVLLKAFKESFSNRKEWKGLSASIGIAFTSQLKDIPFEELLRRADLALYEKKRKGKAGCCVYGSDEV